MACMCFGAAADQRESRPTARQGGLGPAYGATPGADVYPQKRRKAEEKRVRKTKISDVPFIQPKESRDP